MKKTALITAIVAFTCSCASAQEIIRLRPELGKASYPEYVNEEGNIYNVSDPTLTVIPPKGEPNGAAMIVAPGGGLMFLSMKSEGYEPAEWLAEKGYTVFILKYRLRYSGSTKEEIDAATMEMLKSIWFPKGPVSEAFFGDAENPREEVVDLAFSDGLKAIETVKNLAPKYGYSADKVGMIGFSAGAFVTLNAAINHTPESALALAAPIYVGWTGPVVVPEDAPALFLASPQKDVFPPAEPFKVYEAWNAAGKDAQLHFFSHCGHGFGIAPGKPEGIYMDIMYNFMKQTELIK